MSEAEAVEAMWSEYVEATGATGSFVAGSFGADDNPEQQTKLGRLVLDGPKRATTGLYAEYLEEGEPLPKRGDHMVVLDGTGRPLCIIKTTKVEVLRFGSVDGTFAWVEGEGDRSLEYWRSAHLRFFERIGSPIDDDSLVVLEQFDMVWPQPPARALRTEAGGLGFVLANVNGRAVLVRDGFYYDLERVSSGAFPADPRQAVARFADLASFQISGEPDGSMAESRLGPPIPRPRQVFGIGFNYRDHADESGYQPQESPLVFAKFAGCVAGPTDDVVMHGASVDFEGELVVVLGAPARQVRAEDAWGYVAGLTVGQDFSDRSVQFAGEPPQFGLGKSFDGFGPIGPVLVSPERFDDPEDLAIETKVNGEVRQLDRTSSMVFSVGALIEHLSAVLTLYPGDLIFTGTPDGVGYPDGPYLSHGDVVTTTIEGIGTLTNRCVSADLI